MNAFRLVLQGIVPTRQSLVEQMGYMYKVCRVVTRFGVLGHMCVRALFWLARPKDYGVCHSGQAEARRPSAARSLKLRGRMLQRFLVHSLIYKHFLSWQGGRHS